MAEFTGAVKAEPFLAGSGPMEIAVQAARQGAADASAAAAKAWTATAAAVARIIYRTSYTVSYGVVFPLAFVACAIPHDNAAVRGLIEGAEAASRRVDQILGRPSPSG
jgi:hypothetical protein